MQSRWAVACVLAVSLALSAAAQEKTAQSYADHALKLVKEGKFEPAEAELRRAVGLAPQNSSYITELGLVLERQQKLREANSYFERAVKLQPENVETRRHLAINQWRLGQLKEARANLELILKRKPGDPPTILILGIVADNLQDYPAAVRLLSSVPALVRKRSEALAALAHSYYQTGKSSKAQATLTQLMGQPAEPKEVFIGGQVAAAAHDNEMAEKLFESIRNTYPNRAELDYNLAGVLYNANRYSDSEKILEGLIGTGHASSEVYTLLAQGYLKENQFTKAVAEYNQVITLYPQQESGYLELVMVLANARLYHPAWLIAKRATRLFPKSSQAYLAEGLVEGNLSYATQASEAFSRATQLDPDDSDANLGLAEAQYSAGQRDRAFETFEQGIKRFPQDAMHYQEYGIRLLQYAGAGHPEVETHAISLLQTALALDSSLAEPHYQLGNLALKQGHPETAVEQLEAAARLDPDANKIHYALARAYRRLGRSGDASREIALYQKLKAEAENLAANEAQIYGMLKIDTDPPLVARPAEANRE